MVSTLTDLTLAHRYIGICIVIWFLLQLIKILTIVAY